MIVRSLFPRDMYAEIDRLQREMQQSYDWMPNIRGAVGGRFPAVNVASTPTSLEIYAFVPGVDPAAIDVQIEKGVLTIEGARKDDIPAGDGQRASHLDERFEGRFRRVVTLPDDADPNAVQARCTDGVLRISVGRTAAAQPRRITIQ